MTHTADVDQRQPRRVGFVHLELAGRRLDLPGLALVRASHHRNGSSSRAGAAV